MQPHFCLNLHHCWHSWKKKEKWTSCLYLTKCVWTNPRKRKLSPKKCSQLKFKKISYGSQPSTSTSNSTCTPTSNEVASSTKTYFEKHFLKINLKQVGSHSLQRKKMFSWTKFHYFTTFYICTMTMLMFETQKYKMICVNIFESLCQMQNVLKLRNLQEVKIRVTTGLNVGKED